MILLFLHFNDFVRFSLFCWSHTVWRAETNCSVKQGKRDLLLFLSVWKTFYGLYSVLLLSTFSSVVVFFSPLASQVSTSCLRCWNVLCSLFFHLLVFWLWYFCCFYWFLSFFSFLLWAFLLTLFLFVLLLVLLFLLMFLIFPHLLLLLLLIVTFFCCCLHCFYLFPAVYLSCAVVSNVSTYVCAVSTISTYILYFLFCFFCKYMFY